MRREKTKQLIETLRISARMIGDDYGVLEANINEPCAEVERLQEDRDHVARLVSERLRYPLIGKSAETLLKELEGWLCELVAWLRDEPGGERLK